MKLDHDEMRINEAFRKFSTMQVDTEKLKKRVGDKMKNNRKPRRRIGFVLIAAAVMVLLAGTAYAAAGLGMFDRFVDQHDAPFINIVEPVEEFMVIEGVRIDIIAAQQFGNQAIMYMSMQDITG
ncbi:MAG: hypothetical protein FWC89_14225, partial [Defluviitaleaceae bacterium]|nr:hypothetical protein [Defluviitaleaceae bacterium]